MEIEREITDMRIGEQRIVNGHRVTRLDSVYEVAGYSCTQETAVAICEHESDHIELEDGGAIFAITMGQAFLHDLIAVLDETDLTESLCSESSATDCTVYAYTEIAGATARQMQDIVFDAFPCASVHVEQITDPDEIDEIMGA